ncbi:MAG: hypothetical protein OXT09_06460 [Myxococcales bacterium]|nr:hypothetical protein [Myxococcales bacterium]
MTARKMMPALLASFPMVLACAGTSSGNPFDQSDGNDEGRVTGGEFGGEGCEDDAQVVAVDEVTPLGFSAAQILAFVEGAHEETLVWHAGQGVTVEPESGEQALSIEVERGDGEIRYVDSSPDPNGATLGGEIGVACRSRLEIDVLLRLRSAGGALDERFEATLVARSEQLASVRLRPDPSELGGALRITSQLEGYVLAQLDLDIDFTPFGSSGRLVSFLEMRTQDAISESAATGAGPDGAVATWGGAGSCADAHSVALGLDDAVLGNSGRDVVDVLNAVDSAALRYGDGTDTTAMLAFTARGEHACVVLEGEPFGDGSDVGQIELRGQLRLQAEDGRVDASWEVIALALPGEDGPTQVDLRGDWFYLRHQATAEQLFGVSGVDGSGFEELSLDVELSYGRQDGAITVDGGFELVGYLPPDCQPSVETDEAGNATSTGACPAAERRELLRGDLMGPLP